MGHSKSDIDYPSIDSPSGEPQHAPEDCRGDEHPKVLVVGAGTRFLSAMSYYTIRLTNALTTQFSVAAVPMRQLIPTFLYPGRSRVGSMTTRLEYDSG